MSDKLELTLQQELFCREYLVDLNGKAAAIRAKYSAKTAESQASRLLANPRVSIHLQKLMNERAKRTEINADYVLSTIRDTIERCRQGEPVEVWDHESKSMVKTGEWKFEYPGVLKGCELLGKHLKLWVERMEISGNVNLAEKIAKARARVKK
jgi:phage terminase small subunit